MVERVGATFDSCTMVGPSDPVAGSNPVCQHLIFYDNPSRKRDCSMHEYSTHRSHITGMGVEQRLRKGFQDGARKAHIKLGDQLNRMLIALRNKRPSYFKMMTVFGNLESLSSAAEIRHLANNTRL